MSWIKTTLVEIFEKEYIDRITTKAYSEMGTVTGVILTIAINWGHIIEKAIETALLGLIGGIFGALGGLVIAIVKMRVMKYLEKRDEKDNTNNL